MLNIEDVKKKYAAMTDTELLALERYEDHDLTDEALSALQEELTRRKLHDKVTKEQPLNIDEGEAFRLNMVKDKVNYERAVSIWNYIFDTKDKGGSNAEIVSGLIAKGLDKADADNMMEMMEERSRDIQATGIKQMQWGGLILGAGAMATYFSVVRAENKADAISQVWWVFVLGAIWFFRGLSLRNKHKRILSIIADESRAADA